MISDKRFQVNLVIVLFVALVLVSYAFFKGRQRPAEVAPAPAPEVSAPVK